MARSLPSAAREEASAARDRRDGRGGGRRRCERRGRRRASEDLRGQLSNGLARVVVPVSLRSRNVRATERWRRCERVHGHCRRRGYGGDPRRKSCRERAGFPSNGELYRESRPVLRAADSRSTDLPARGGRQEVGGAPGEAAGSAAPASGGHASEGREAPDGDTAAPRCRLRTAPPGLRRWPRLAVGRPRKRARVRWRCSRTRAARSSRLARMSRKLRRFSSLDRAADAG